MYDTNRNSCSRGHRKVDREELGNTVCVMNSAGRRQRTADALSDGGSRLRPSGSSKYWGAYSERKYPEMEGKGLRCGYQEKKVDLNRLSPKNEGKGAR